MLAVSKVLFYPYLLAALGAQPLTVHRKKFHVGPLVTEVENHKWYYSITWTVVARIYCTIIVHLRR